MNEPEMKKTTLPACRTMLCLTLALGLAAVIAPCAVAPAEDRNDIRKDIQWPDVEPSPRLKPTTNLLQNPGFENDADRDGVPDQWVTFVPLGDGITCVWDSGIGRAGSRSVSVKGALRRGAGMWQQVVAVKSGTVYILSGYVGFENVRPGSGCNLQLVFRSRENDVLKMVDFPRHQGTRELAYDFPREMMVRAPEGAAKVEVNLILRGQGRAVFDDVFFGLAPVGHITGVVTTQGVPLQGARVAVWGKPWGIAYEAVTDRSGAYKISGLPVTSPRYILLARKETYKTRPQGDVGVTADDVTTVNFDLRHGSDPVDDLRIKFASVASVRHLPALEIPVHATIPPDAKGYPEEIRPYLESDDCITPNDPAVERLAKQILDSLPAENRSNACEVAYAVFSWVSHNIEHDGVYSAKDPRRHRMVIEGNHGRIIPTEDDYNDVTSGIWQTVTDEGWCWGRSFYDWGFKPAETLRERGVICVEQAWLCCALLRAMNVPARSSVGANQFWAQRRRGKGQWVFMSTTGGRTGYRTRGSLKEGFGGPRAQVFQPVSSRPVLHEDWSVENKCLWREIHPFQERYDHFEQALEDLEQFESTGEASRAPRVRFPLRTNYLIHYSDLTINLYNMGRQRTLDVRFPIISDSEVFTPTGHKAHWTNHPECVRRTWVEEITNPPVPGKERWFHVEFDLTSLIDGRGTRAAKQGTSPPGGLRPMSGEGSAVKLDDSPFGFLELFEPYEPIGDGAINNPFLVRGLARPGAGGRRPRSVAPDVFFNFIGGNARELGVRWTRSDVFGGLWRTFIEREKGRYDWSGSDQVIAAAKRRGVHTLVRINPQSAWQRDRSSVHPKMRFPTDVQAYRRFIRVGVERYDGDGVSDAPGSPRVDCWQIGNEPDGFGMWDDSPEKWAELHRITYQEIKAADPDAIVLLAGCATHPGMRRFYTVVLAELARDGKRWFDVADFHFNQPWSAFWPSVQGDYRGLIRAVKDFRALLERNGFDHAPLWITECGGYSDRPPQGRSGGLLPLVTEREHATDLVQRYVLALSLGVKKIFWTGMLERFAEREDNYFAHTGLIYDGRFDPPGVRFGDRKPAFYAYKKMVELLGNSDWDRIETLLDGSKGAFAIRFPAKSDRRSVIVVWAASEPGEKDKPARADRTIAVPVKSNVSRVVAVASVPRGQGAAGGQPKEVVFEETPIVVKDGFCSVPLGTVPLYLKVEPDTTAARRAPYRPHPPTEPQRPSGDSTTASDVRLSLCVNPAYHLRSVAAGAAVPGSPKEMKAEKLILACHGILKATAGDGDLDVICGADHGQVRPRGTLGKTLVDHGDGRFRR